MRNTLLILVGLISIGSLGTVATESEQVAQDRSSQSLGGGGCFGFVEKVAFTTTRDNPNFTPIQNAGELYIMDPDGTNPERITDNFVQDSFGVLSPDGKKFVFDSNRLRLETDPINLVDLFVMATDGSEETHLTRGSSAAWNPDSRNIVYHASASGTGLPIRMDPGAPATDSDIFILNVDDAAIGQPAPINMTNTPTLIEDDPNWSPDGTKIVYTAHLVTDHPTLSNTAEIFVINADGSGSPVQLTFNNEEERAAAWSPDGTKIVFMCRYGGTDFEICTINPDSSGLVQITNNAVQELSIRWSMDGTQFWFNRPVTYPVPPVRMQLFRINVDGTGETQMTDTVGINLFPTAGWLRVRTECAASQTISAVPADAFLSWTVSPGTFANGVWTIPGTTTLTASITDAFGDPITEGQLVWETCSGAGQDLGTHHPAAHCQQPGPVRWRGARILDPANPTSIAPCFCAGDQQGFRLAYRSRGSGFGSTTGAPFDLFAESNCPRRLDCP